MQRNRRKEVKQTVLVYTEGPHDAAFIKYLNIEYGRGHPTKTHKVKNGQGGAPVTLVETMLKHVEYNNYDEAHISFDNDVGPESCDLAVSIVQEAISNGVPVKSCIQITGCMEVLLLGILDSKHDYSAYTSDAAKKKFHAEYIPETQRGNTSAYVTLFPKELLEEARKRLPDLDAIIKQFD